jgi:hypothetical protein
MKLKFTLYKNGKPVNITDHTIIIKFNSYLKDQFQSEIREIKIKGINSREYRDLIKRFFAHGMKMQQQLKDFNTLCELLFPVLVIFTEKK